MMFPDRLSADDLLYSTVLWKYLLLYWAFRVSIRTDSQVAHCLWFSMASAALVAVVGILQVGAMLAQFERSLIQERVQAGLAAARRRGRRGGRPTAIDAEKLAAVTSALDSGASKAAVCRTFGIKRSTLIDALARIGWSAGSQSRET